MFGILGAGVVTVADRPSTARPATVKAMVGVRNMRPVVTVVVAAEDTMGVAVVGPVDMADVVVMERATVVRASFLLRKRESWRHWS